MSNLDDFDAPPGNFEPEEAPQQRQRSIGQNIASAWQASPVFKIFLLLVGGGAIASAALGVFNANEQTDSKSVVREGSEITATPGGEAPPAFQEAVNAASRQRAQNAANQGGSAFPTPLGNTTQMTGLDQNGANPEDPLAEFRAPSTPEQRPAAAPSQQQQQQQAAMQPTMVQQVPVEPPLDQNLAAAIQQQMQSLLGSWQPQNARVIKIAEVSTTDANGRNGNGTGNGGEETPFNYGKTLIAAGTINYGQMLIEANSDVPGPVMAQILSGPFAGGRAIGRFQTMEEHLVIIFNLVNYKGKDYPVNALALNPDTTLGGMATEVDHRYWSRVILPAAAEFISGFADAFSQADQNIYIQDGVVVSERASGSLRQGLGQGFSEAGNRVADIVNEQGSRIKTLVRVAAGTPVGVFFTQSVTENTPPQPQRQQIQPYPGQSFVNGSQQAIQNQYLGQYQPQYYGATGDLGTSYGGAVPGYAPTGYGQTTQNGYNSNNRGSSSTNYGSGVTVIPTGGTPTVINTTR